MRNLVSSGRPNEFSQNWRLRGLTGKIVNLETKSAPLTSLVPRPFRREKGLVSTVCACVSFSHFSGKQDSSTVG